MDQPLVTQSVARVRAWLAANAPAEKERKAIADRAEVHEKTLRLAHADDWNPRRKTLEKIEALIPANFMPAKPKKRARASA